MKYIGPDKSEIVKAPQLPGVYRFVGENDEILYIGKAKNLRSRLQSYFSKAVTGKTSSMVRDALGVEITPVDSEFEALLLEAKLIRKYKPSYNIELKDDKSPIYVGITKERYPRILLFRQSNLDTQLLSDVFGPFQSAKEARLVLKILRKTFPFAQHKVSKRACIYTEIGLCDPCPSVIEQCDEPLRGSLRRQYLKNVSYVRRVLNGSLQKVLNELDKKMQGSSQKQNFEEAQSLHRQILHLKRATSDPVNISAYIEDPNFLSDVREREVKALTEVVNEFVHVNLLGRIECFDVAHLAGTYPTASMATFVNGSPEKKYYRHFKVRQQKKRSDVDSLREVMSRRSKHFEDWGLPDLLLIDGGKPQVAAAIGVIGKSIPVVGIAKRYETLVFYKDGKFIEHKLKKGPALYLVQRLRDEAHRFARRYHHKLVAKAMITHDT